MLDKQKDGMSLFQLISFIYLFGMGIYTSLRGFYWIMNAESASQESELYSAMHEIISLAFWGLPFAISGILLMASAIAMPYHRTNTIFLTTFVIGHAIAAPFYYIFTLAGFENGINLLTPMQNLSLSVMCGAMAFVGGVALWNNKINKK